MIDIEYLERKKTELIAYHVKVFGVTPLSDAEKLILNELDWQIRELKKKRGDQDE